jgi:hypothetical protein
VQVTFVTVAVIMALAALVLLVVGIMSTGATRTNVYQGARARLGGRISCAVFMVFTYLLNLCWLVVLSLTVVLCFSYMVFSTLCGSVGGFSESHCLNLTVLRPVLTDDTTSVRLPMLNNNSTLCRSAAYFCNLLKFLFTLVLL